MQLTHRFTVPTPVEATWDHFNDLEGLAECFPGATVTSVEGDSFEGTAKVKLGPIALLYKGSGHFVEKDESGRRMVMEAKGKDKRGNGTAGATVTMTMAESAQAAGSTDVEVLTDLQVTGKPAQFGRGVMQDVSDKLLGQFVDCLEHRLGQPEAEPDPAEAAPAEAGPSEAASPLTAEPSGDPSAAAAPAGAAAGGPAAATEPPRPAPPPRPAGGEDAVDLGTTVLPVLAKTYWKQALGAVLVLLVLRWLLGRRGGR